MAEDMETKNGTIQIAEETMCNWWCDCSLYKHSECFEFKMKYGDCRMCCHQGSCDDDCEQMRNEDYIRKQLDQLTNDQLFGYVSEYICDEDISDKVSDRNWLEVYTIWLVAGDIIDDIYMGYSEDRICS